MFTIELNKNKNLYFTFEFGSNLSFWPINEQNLYFTFDPNVFLKKKAWLEFYYGIFI